MSDPDPGDLTARARIRDASLQQFGEHGFDRATIRGIAERAGVSSGLVRHHFGSKQALREACDEHLIRTIRRLDAQSRAELTRSTVNPVAALRPYQQYLGRMLADGSAGPLFDEMVRLAEERLDEADRDSPDPPDVPARSRAAMITAMALSVPAFHLHLSRAMGVDVLAPEGEQLLLQTLIHLYSHPLLSPEDAATARAALDLDRAGTPRASEERTP